MRARSAVLLGLSATGCNLVFGLDAPVPADPVDAREVDAPPLGRFGEPRPVTTTADLIENDAILTADETEVIYAISTMAMTPDIVRASVSGGEWGPPEPTSLSTNVTDAFLRFGRGDTTIYFASDRPGGPGLLDIFRATRDDPSSDWSNPEVMLSLSSVGNDLTSAPCAADTRFVITSDRGGANALYEYDTQRGDAPAMFPVPIERPRSPFLTEDCLTLYFAAGTLGDLYVMRRDAVEAPWSPPEAIGELNTVDGSESDPWLSPSGRHILFSRDGDIWEAFR